MTKPPKYLLDQFIHVGEPYRGVIVAESLTHHHHHIPGGVVGSLAVEDRLYEQVDLRINRHYITETAKNCGTQICDV